MFISLLSWLIWTTAQAAGPLWTIVPTPGSNPTQIVPENGTATVQYMIQNQSGKSKRLVIQSIQGIIQTGSCLLAPKGQSGSNCTLNLAVTGSTLPQGGVHGGPALCQANSDGSPNPNQCYQPSSANSLNITRGSPVMISVNPTTLLFAENSTGDVTVTNNASSSVAAENVIAAIPGGSNISVQSTTCGASLAIGASCTITFASGTLEGPTTIPIAGDNTNTVNVSVTVTNQPQISITNPIQQNRVVTVSPMPSLSLEVTNDGGSMVNANAITVTDKTACPNLTVNDTDCTSVAPGASCTLILTSNTPYVPCTITVSGSNTANSPQALIAFSYLGGLVFQESGGNGKVVIDVAAEITRSWTDSPGPIPGTTLDDGANNTDLIVANASCSNVPNNCAAAQCRNLGAEWYLPAGNELTEVQDALCSNLATPCNFGEFAPVPYWSSTQDGNNTAFSVSFPNGAPVSTTKVNPHLVRCAQAFPPP
ncbi:DUF1566 domain-containing protein [Legionella antarctica]|nr:DUF1566 domain-containing protein [Legionella antarctica]